MNEQLKITKCPTCGSSVFIKTGSGTNFFTPIKDNYEERLLKQELSQNLSRLFKVLESTGVDMNLPYIKSAIEAHNNFRKTLNL